MKTPELKDTMNKFLVASGLTGVRVMMPFFNAIPAEDALNLAAWLYVMASMQYEDQAATDEAFSAFVERIRNA